MSASPFILLVHTLQLTTSTSLIFLAGLSSCLSLWVLPLTALLPPYLAVKQFNQTVTWGMHYLQPTSRILAASLLLTTILTSLLPNAEDAEKWRVWAMALAVLVPVAPYEVWYIFPINDRVGDIGDEVERGGGEKVAKAELKVLFKKWQWRNFGRVGIPLVAGVVGWFGVVRA